MHHRSHDQGGLYSGRAWADTPLPIHGILRDTVNKRAVRILLECILIRVRLREKFLNLFDRGIIGKCGDMVTDHIFSF